jgi:hypothetical protein
MCAVPGSARESRTRAYRETRSLLHHPSHGRQRLSSITVVDHLRRAGHAAVLFASPGARTWSTRSQTCSGRDGQRSRSCPWVPPPTRPRPGACSSFGSTVDFSAAGGKGSPPGVAWCGLVLALALSMYGSKSKDGTTLRPAQTQDRQPGLESTMKPRPKSEDEGHVGSRKLSWPRGAHHRRTTGKAESCPAGDRGSCREVRSPPSAGVPLSFERGQ